MVRSMPRLAGHLLRIQQAVAAESWVRRWLVGVDDAGAQRWRGPATDREAEYLSVSGPIWGRVTCDRYATSAGDLGRSLAIAFVRRRVYGCAPIERTWSVDDHGRMQLEVYPVHPSTIQNWVYTLDGRRFLGLSVASEQGWGVIPADRVAPMTWHPEEGPEGRSELRSLYLDNELLYEAKRGWTRRQVLAGGFAMVRVIDDAADENANKEALLRTLGEFATGGAAHVYVPKGYEFSVVHPGSSDDGPLEYATYVDGEVDHVVGSWVAGINLHAAGSRALAEVLQVEDRRLWVDTLVEHGIAYAAVEAGVARDLGYGDITPPVWVPADVAMEGGP